MTIQEQFDVINTFRAGEIEVYYKHDFGDWTLVTEGHQFDFNSYEYHIGKPLSFVDNICHLDSKEAFKECLTYLKDKYNLFMTIESKDQFGRKIDTYSGLKSSKLYKLWNLAVQYGRKSDKELKDITFEDNEKLLKECI